MSYGKSFQKAGKKSVWLAEGQIWSFWQITPRILPKMLMDKNQKKANNVMAVMMEMNKIIIKDLQAAYDAA